MKVKKKITRQSYDYVAEREYYREAQICPNCGNKGNEGDMVIGLVQESAIQYTCSKCGCQWEVEFYCGNKLLPGILEVEDEERPNNDVKAKQEEYQFRREFLEMMHREVENFERIVKDEGSTMPKRMREAFYKLHGVEEKN